MTKAQGYMDKKFKCEDITLTFIFSSLSCSSPLLVLGDEKVPRFQIPKYEAPIGAKNPAWAAVHRNYLDR